MTNAVDIRLTRRSLRCQYEAFGTLWTDRQIEVLESSILTDLQAEFGPMVSEEKTPLQHAVGWLDENDFSLGGRPDSELEHFFDGFRVCHCLGCGQRIVWRPTAYNVQACSRRCAKRVTDKNHQATIDAQLHAAAEARRVAQEKDYKKEKELEERKRQYEKEERKRQYAKLAPDPVSLPKIIDSLHRQLEEQNNTRARFVAAHLVQNKWTVLEFAMTSQFFRDRTVYIVLNGSGPGRAAWSIHAVSAEQAVQQTAGRRYSPNVGMPQ